MKTLKTDIVRTVWYLLAAVLLLGGGASTHGQIIPASRRINWDPGIPGGIPVRTTIYTTLSSIDSSGATDVTAAIQSALNQCPANQVVKLPAGTFRINGSLSMPSNVTLRGSGPSTVLRSHGSAAGLVKFGTSGIPWNPSTITTTISSGATAGATSFTVASNSGITVGSYLVVTELNDPAYVSIDGTLNGAATWVDGWNTAGARARGQIVEVTSVSGTTIGFTPALYSSFTRTPWATRFTAQSKWSGVEDLKTYANNTGTERNFLFQCAAYCWVKNVECDYTDGDHVSLDWSFRCEIRHSYFHDAYVHTSGSFDNMIGLRYKSTACLVIDNIIRRLHVAVMCEWGAAGNVVAYNYDEGNFDQAASSGNRWLPVSMNSNHGAHPQFNLFEGNVSQKFQADAYWGSSSDTTIFRNYFSGTGVTHPPYTGRGAEDTSVTAVLIQGNRAIDIWELQATHSVVGNVIGSPALTSRSVVRKVVNPASRAYDNPPYCFSYGYTSESGGGGTALQNPTTTLIEHGNYDVKTAGVVWDASIADHNIPDSLFLSGKPAWFGNLTFPPIDPTRPSVLPSHIPAGYRYLNGIDPPTGGSGNLPPVAAASANPVSGIMPLAVTFSSAGSNDPEGTALTYNWVFGDGTTSTSANPSKTYSTAGSYSARLTVSDGVNSTSSSNIAISVSATNQPPVVAASASPSSGTAPLVVAFSSAGTSDPEGQALTYSWNFGDSTSSTAANPSKTYQAIGTYTVRLTVSDGTNSVVSAPVGVTVVAAGSGLVAAFGFEEGNGVNVADSSGFGNNGSVTAATWVDGKFGKALSFNGTNAMVSVPNSASLTMTNAVTVEAWVYKTSSTASWKPIMFKPINASQISFVLQGETPQSVAAFFVSPSASNLVTPATLPLNTWAHVVGTYDGSSMKMYVNGVQVSNKAQTGALTMSSEALTIGGSSLYSAYWQGIIDEVRVYNRALSASEIQANMTMPVRPLAPKNLRVSP